MKRVSTYFASLWAPDFSRNLLAQRLDQVYQTTPLANLISLSGAAMGFVIFAWQGVSWQLTLWLFVLSIVTMIRHRVYVAHRHVPNEHGQWFWWRILIAIATAHGFAWGLVAFHPFDDPYLIKAAVFPFIVGIGAINYYGTILRVYCLFWGSLLASLIVGGVWFNHEPLAQSLLPTFIVGSLLFGIGKTFGQKVIEQCALQVELQRLNTTLQDINASLRHEIAERNRAQQALTESEYRFQKMVDTAPIMIWLFNENPSGMLVNPQAQQFLGVQTPEVPCNVWLDAMHPEDKPKCVATFTNAVTRKVSFEREYRLRNAQGNYRWVVEHGVPRVAPDDRFLGYISTCADITERREAEQARLEAAIAQRNVLVREVHHRIKNHLQGLINLLDRFTLKCPEAAGFFDEAVAQTQVIATIHGFQARSAASQLDVAEMLTAIATTVETLSGIPVRIDMPEPDTRTSLEETHSVSVALAINELLLNAAKHGQFDAEHAYIEVTAKRTGDVYYISIRNPGHFGSEVDNRTSLTAGTGLNLAQLLLPSHMGADLKIGKTGDWVEATLELRPPVIQ